MSAYSSQSTARQLEEQERYLQQPAVPFTLIRGGGLDAQVRKGVTPRFVAIIKVATLITTLVIALGFVRVAITTGTVGLLKANLDTRAEMAQMEKDNTELRIERSILSSASRITRIATQNYGMVLPKEHDRIALPPNITAENSQGAQ